MIFIASERSPPKRESRHFEEHAVSVLSVISYTEYLL